MGYAEREAVGVNKINAASVSVELDVRRHTVLQIIHSLPSHLLGQTEVNSYRSAEQMSARIFSLTLGKSTRDPLTLKTLSLWVFVS
jgi:hypothetical protein